MHSVSEARGKGWGVVNGAAVTPHVTGIQHIPMRGSQIREDGDEINVLKT